MAKVQKKADVSYQEMSSELSDILVALQQDDVSVDAALNYYKRGLEVTAQLKEYLESAENTVKKLQAKYRSDA